MEGAKERTSLLGSVEAPSVPLSAASARIRLFQAMSSSEFVSGSKSGSWLSFGRWPFPSSGASSGTASTRPWRSAPMEMASM